MSKVLEQPQAAAQETSGAALPLEDDAALQEVEAQLALEEDADMETYGMVSDGSNVANGSTASETNATQEAAATSQKEMEETKDVNPVMGLVDRGIISFGEYAIVKKLTGNKLIAAAVTIGGQVLGVLPKSVSPILEGVASIVGKDSDAGKTLTSMSDKLTGKSLEQTEEAEEDVKTSGQILAEGMETSFSQASTNADWDIRVAMDQNARDVVEQDVFLSVKETDLAQVEAMAQTSGEALQGKAVSMVPEGGKLSEVNKDVLADQYENLLEGVEAYSKAAEEQIKVRYAGNEASLSAAQANLERTMQATAGPLMTSLQAMDEQYGLLDEAAKERLDRLEIAGVESYSEYEPEASYVFSEESEADLLYEDGALDAEDVTPQKAQEGDFSEQGMSSKASQEKSQEMAKSGGLTGVSRGAEAEARLGTFETEENSEEYAFE